MRPHDSGEVVEVYPDKSHKDAFFEWFKKWKVTSKTKITICSTKIKRSVTQLKMRKVNRLKYYNSKRDQDNTEKKTAKWRKRGILVEH